MDNGIKVENNLQVQFVSFFCRSLCHMSEYPFDANAIALAVDEAAMEY